MSAEGVCLPVLEHVEARGVLDFGVSLTTLPSHFMIKRSHWSSLIWLDSLAIKLQGCDYFQPFFLSTPRVTDNAMTSSYCMVLGTQAASSRLCSRHCTKPFPSPLFYLVLLMGRRVWKQSIITQIPPSQDK